MHMGYSTRRVICWMELLLQSFLHMQAGTFSGFISQADNRVVQGAPARETVRLPANPKKKFDIILDFLNGHNYNDRERSSFIRYAMLKEKILMKEIHDERSKKQIAAKRLQNDQSKVSRLENHTGL
jgi:hypothetical protein